jgi:hypothetical protein
MKQIKTILSILLLLHASFSFSQTWPKYYGEIGKYDFSEDILETYDRGYLMSGNIHDYNNGTSKNGWLIKTDINGEILWEKIFDNDLHLSKINAIEQTNDGGVVICGSVRIVINQTQPIVIKLNACGEKEWCKIFYTPFELPWAQDIKETETGEIIVLVNQFGENPEETMHLFKLSASGDLLWQKPFCSMYVHPECAQPLGKKLLITSNGKYLIAGNVYWEEPWNPGGPKPLCPLFVLADSMGMEKWVLPFGLSDTIHGEALGILDVNFDNFIGVGYFWPNQGYDEGLIMEFDNMGNEINFRRINAKEIDDSFNRLLFYEAIRFDTLVAFGGVIGVEFVGNPTMETISDTNLFNNVSFTNYIQHYNLITPYSLGRTSDNKLLSNSTHKETGNWEIALSKLNLNLEGDTAYLDNYTYDSLCIPGPPQSGFIFLDDCEIITGTSDMPTPEQYYASLKTIPITAYPNPAREREVTFEFENTEYHQNMELRCFNVYGEPVHKEKVYKHQGESKINISNWQKGIYIAIVYSNGLPVGRCKFVVR